MSVSYLHTHGLDGRIRGSYVYMLLCQDADGPIYIKTGISDSPLQRFSVLRNNCPVQARIFSFVEVHSRKAAKALEQDLLSSFDAWRTNGEWIGLDPSEKGEFNAAWQAVFQRHARKHWPLRWTQVSAGALIKRAEEKQRYFRRKLARRGQAFRDFFYASTGSA